MADHTITLSTDALDQVAKSLMQSRTAITRRRRRIDPNTKLGREVADEASHIDEALRIVEAAQEESWSSQGE